MKLIVGLGNPGKKFEKTRHNLGFIFVNRLALELKQDKWENKGKFKALVNHISKDLVLLKPQTFMNNSGLAVAKAVQFYKIKLKNIYLCHDDLDIKLGEYKIQFAKGPKEHNGINSVEKYLKNKQFWRLRVGVENRDNQASGSKISGEEYVLKDFNKDEAKIVFDIVEKAVKDIILKISNNKPL